MINLRLTTEQAQELADLLNSMAIEPVSFGATLVEIFNQAPEHPLWPVLKALRHQMLFQPSGVAQCGQCGQPITRSKRGGQPKKYCSGACKQKATRTRAKAIA